MFIKREERKDEDDDSEGEDLEPEPVDESKGNTNEREFGEDCMPHNTVEVFIKGYNHHLSTPDGGCKDNAQIKQRCAQVR